ncbi:protein arginine N-methyltransferase 8 [Drosophila kikkawai]|uniref:type I protein arginine methyltransferase n=1 Tax=Drosophila kikkawai TaxID=30033 RepID=A0A6P4J4I0_DROKI|nr:protein arginine N-methyltransferase 8 [Drosophila kikkawai]
MSQVGAKDRKSDEDQALKLRREQEALYFQLYSRLEVQEWLLKDSVRNKAYREAILNNKAFKNKVVLEVGCGLGMLSIFAARSGASRVIAVDGSNVTDYTSRIAEDNGHGNVITVVHGKVENIELPEDIHQVDILICDWMGHCLFSENMLESLIFARDKWLAKGGLIFPDSAQLYLAAIHGEDQDLGFWHDVHGFDFNAIRRRCAAKALVEHVTTGQVMSRVYLVKSLDLYAVRSGSSAFRSFYDLRVTRNGHVHGLLAYFDVGFSKSQRWVSFSTSPSAPWTHWNQTVFYLEAPLPVRSGESIKGVFGIQPSAESIFDLEFDIYVDFEGKEKSVTSKQSFVLSSNLQLGGV